MNREPRTALSVDEAVSERSPGEIQADTFAELYAVDRNLLHAVYPHEPGHRTDTDEVYPQGARVHLSGRRLPFDIYLPEPGQLPFVQGRLGSAKNGLEIPNLQRFFSNLAALDASARAFQGGAFKNAEAWLMARYVAVNGSDRLVMLYDKQFHFGGHKKSIAPLVHDLPVTELLQGDTSTRQPEALQAPTHTSDIFGNGTHADMFAMLRYGSNTLHLNLQKSLAGNFIDSIQVQQPGQATGFLAGGSPAQVVYTRNWQTMLWQTRVRDQNCNGPADIYWV